MERKCDVCKRQVGQGRQVLIAAPGNVCASCYMELGGRYKEIRTAGNFIEVNVEELQTFLKGGFPVKDVRNSACQIAQAIDEILEYIDKEKDEYKEFDTAFDRRDV